MKTTFEISDALLNEARRIATRDRRTVRALVEEGLRRVIAERKRGGQFTLRKATFKGQGLAPGLSDWAHVRDAADQGRGV